LKFMLISQKNYSMWKSFIVSRIIWIRHVLNHTAIINIHFRSANFVIFCHFFPNLQSRITLDILDILTSKSIGTLWDL
jgi:hypothetical protein